MVDRNYSLLLSVRKVHLMFQLPVKGEITVTFKYGDYREESQRIPINVGPSEVGTYTTVETYNCAFSTVCVVRETGASKVDK